MPMTEQQRAITGNSPRDLRVNAPHGRIYENDPAAVARLKQMMAEKQEKRQAQARRQTSKRNASGDADLARKRDEILARAAQKAAGVDEQKGENNVNREPRMTDDAVLAVHRRYVLENLSIEDLARNLPVTGNTLAKYFDRLDLPVRDRGGKWTTRGQARCCQVHDLALADVRNSAAAAVAPAPEAPAPEAPAKPKPEPEPKPARIARPTLPTPSANGNGTAKEPVTAVAVHSRPAAPTVAPAVVAGDMGAQIAALQSFLATATARSVAVTGSIQIELSARIEF